GDADVGLRESGSVVGAVAGHGDEFSFRLFVFDERHLVFRLGFGQEIVDAGLTSDSGGGEGGVAGDHHGADAHGAEGVEGLLHTALDDVRERDSAENATVLGNEERSPASVRNFAHTNV